MGGDDIGSKRIQPDTIMQIKHMLDCGCTYMDIRVELGVSPTVILHTKKGKYDELVKDCEPVQIDEHELRLKRFDSLKRQLNRRK